MAAKVIFVLGMHRSGTSALSGVLSLLGVDTAMKTIKKKKENQKGFFEHPQLRTINRGLLLSFGHSWDDLAIMPDDWWKSAKVEKYRKMARKVVASIVEGSSLFLFKDPRACLLIPFWRDVFAQAGIDVQCLIANRNPFEVAASLSRRNDFTVEKSAILWANYMLNAELYTRDCPRMFVNFDDMLEQPDAFLKHIEEFINPPVSYFDDKGTVSNFLEKKLKHHNSQDAYPEDMLFISDFYQSLVDARYQVGAANLAETADSTLQQLHERYKNGAFFSTKESLVERIKYIVERVKFAASL